MAKAKAKKKTTVSKTKEAKPKKIEIVNIVVSGQVDQDKIPLEKMAATLPNTEYNPEQFPGLVLRIREPKTSALIFNSGKIVCTGAKNMEKVEQAMGKIVEALKKIGVNIKSKPQYQVQNMVASGDIGMEINLNTLAIKLENTEYEPEQFPGLVYKLKGTHATFLLFTNGQIVCTGTKSKAEVEDAVQKLIKKLKEIK
ncbi:TATA-box-binding protein [Candidatus Woesearchaeota archaeon]|nr:TATA-box-binding protein [Candidatus Woesearchaeota archaeon]